jgi:hypothetical protein
MTEAGPWVSSNSVALSHCRITSGDYRTRSCTRVSPWLEGVYVGSGSRGGSGRSALKPIEGFVGHIRGSQLRVSVASTSSETLTTTGLRRSHVSCPELFHIHCSLKSPLQAALTVLHVAQVWWRRLIMSRPSPAGPSLARRQRRSIVTRAII